MNRFEPAAVFEKIRRRANAAVDAATVAAASRALSDSNYFVRYHSGALMASSLEHSLLHEGKLIWKTDYAVEVYYIGKPRTHVNPNASLMWAHKAADLYKDQWHAAARQAFRAYFER